LRDERYPAVLMINSNSTEKLKKRWIWQVTVAFAN